MNKEDNINICDSLFKELETPCFVVNTPDFCDNIGEFKSALADFFPFSVLSYSVKTNSLPYLLSLACACGLHAEVVSADEFALAKAVGFSCNKIVYNGPMKSKETFLEALSGGAFVNVETQRELEWLQDYKGDRNCKLGIRVNIDLNELSKEDAVPGEENSRFGFDAENGELEKAIQIIERSGIALNGLHVHRTSKTRSLTVYEAICNYTGRIIDRYNLNLSFVDIGGGYYGKMPGKPDYFEYAQTIKNSLNVDWKNTTLIVEPGNALLASPIDYVMSVIDKKRVGNRNILTCDGSRLDVDPFFHKKQYRYETVVPHVRNKIESQTLCGCTCLEKDIITVLENERELEVGDRIQLKWQGAYTMALTPNFIRLLPNIYAFDGASYSLVRGKWKARDLMANSIMDPMPAADGYLFLNAGRRATLLKDFKDSLGVSAKIVAADNWCVAPALFTADKYYLIPKIHDPAYISKVMEICKKEKISAVTTNIDPEIEILAKHRNDFLDNGILPLCPDEKTAQLCFDKYQMFLYLREKGIPTVLTYDSLASFNEGFARGEISFPVFIKPRSGSGSVGAERIRCLEELEDRFKNAKYDYIIQEFMDCEDCDADVYIDTISHKAVSAVLKKKIETRIGGASKTIAFKDERLFDFIRQICEVFCFNGPVDMDFFYRDGVYYLSEINPRFGGAYLHGYGAGADFPKLIRNNIHGIENPDEMGNYEDASIMLMYDDVIMTNQKELKGDYRS